MMLHLKEEAESNLVFTYLSKFPGHVRGSAE